MPGKENSEMVGPWPKGMNNLLRNSQVGHDTLRNAVNVDVKADGTLDTRRGYTQKISGVYHSLWSDSGIALCVKNDALTQLSVAGDGTVSEITLRAGMTPGFPVAYVWVNGSVYYSNGVVTGRVLNKVDLPWGVEHAARPAAATAVAIGGLAAGRYQVATTFVTATGEEGGTSSAISVVVAAGGGGIALTGIAQPTQAQVTKIRLYVTAANGEVFYQYADLAVGTTAINLFRSTTLGVNLQTWNCYPPPAGTVLEDHNGVIVIGQGPYLFFTEPFRYGQYKLTNFYTFPAEITILSSVATDTLCVVADTHQLLTGTDMKNLTVVPSHNFGAVKGTHTLLPNNAMRQWVTPQGLMLANGADLKPQLRDQVAIDEATLGATLYREQDGEFFLIAALRDGASSVAVAKDFADAEVIRKQ